MRYDPDRHHRRSIRLSGFDYSRSAIYFVTICVQNRECLFGSVSHDFADRQISLSDAGQMVVDEWLAGASQFLFSDRQLID